MTDIPWMDRIIADLKLSHPDQTFLCFYKDKGYWRIVLKSGQYWTHDMTVSHYLKEKELCPPA
jgi:hypothetical protein